MIHRPSRSLTWRTLSLLPSPMSTNGSSSAPTWTAVGFASVIVMTPVCPILGGGAHRGGRRSCEQGDLGVLAEIGAVDQELDAVRERAVPVAVVGGVADHPVPEGVDHPRQRSFLGLARHEPAAEEVLRRRPVELGGLLGHQRPVLRRAARARTEPAPRPPRRTPPVAREARQDTTDGEAREGEHRAHRMGDRVLGQPGREPVDRHWDLAGRLPAPVDAHRHAERSATDHTTSKVGSSRLRSRMCCAVTIPTKPCSVTQRSSSSAAAPGSSMGSLATSLRRSGANAAYSARASLRVRHNAGRELRVAQRPLSPDPAGTMTVTSIPSRVHVLQASGRLGHPRSHRRSKSSSSSSSHAAGRGFASFSCQPPARDVAVDALHGGHVLGHLPPVPVRVRRRHRSGSPP